MGDRQIGQPVLEVSMVARIGYSLTVLMLLFPAAVVHFDIGNGPLRSGLFRSLIWASSAVATIFGIRFVWWLFRTDGVFLRLGPTDAIVSAPTRWIANPQNQRLSCGSGKRIAGTYWHEERRITDTRTQDAIAVRLISGGNKVEIRVPVTMLKAGFEDKLTDSGVQRRR